MRKQRRHFVKGILSVGVLGIAGCSGSESAVTITGKQVLSGDGRMGVRITLQDNNPGQETPVEVHGKLVDGGDVLAETHKKITLASQDPVDVDFWFDDVQPADGYTAQGHVHVQ